MHQQGVSRNCRTMVCSHVSWGSNPLMLLTYLFARFYGPAGGAVLSPGPKKKVSVILVHASVVNEEEQVGEW